MYIVTLTYKVPMATVEKYLKAHREYLDYHYKMGLILASGPLNPRTGGIIIALTQDREQLEEILQQDPYYVAEIADYSLTEFIPVKHRDEIKTLIAQSEGNLC